MKVQILCIIAFIGLGCKEFDLDVSSVVFIEPQGTAVIKIKSNRTTGYSWEIFEGLSEDLLADPQGRYIAPNTSAKGASGHQIFEITCSAGCIEGRVYHVILRYKRPWEDSSAQTKEIRVIVTTDIELLN